MECLRSNKQFLGIERSLQRAWAKGAGLIDEEFERPMIAVVNTYQEFSPENIHLRQVGEAVKSGIRIAGGTPCEFNTFHVTDSETFASVGMRYVLPSRDLVADMIELMVEGHRFDAMVLIGSGDKVVPGMVMAAARLDLPSILLYGGPTKAGRYKNRKVFLETVYDGVGEHILGKLSEEDLKGLEDNHFPFAGACDTATSGNTAGIYTEALGLALPNSGTLPAGSNFQLRAAKYTGMRIMDLVRDDLRPSRILTPESFENAMRVGLAVGGSTNMVLHMIAMAKEAGVEVNFDTWDRLSRETPTLVKLAPSGAWGVTDLGEAGGVPAVMKALGNLINPGDDDCQRQSHRGTDRSGGHREHGMYSQPGATPSNRMVRSISSGVALRQAERLSKLPVSIARCIGPFCLRAFLRTRRVRSTRFGTGRFSLAPAL